MTQRVVVLCLAAAALPAQTLTDDELFAGLDLGRPGREAVAAAAGRGDRPVARHALAECYRHRARPVYLIPLGENANPKPARPDNVRAERALRHEFESIGYGTFPHSRVAASRMEGRGLHLIQ